MESSTYSNPPSVTRSEPDMYPASPSTSSTTEPPKLVRRNSKKNKPSPLSIESITGGANLISPRLLSASSLNTPLVNMPSPPYSLAKSPFLSMPPWTISPFALNLSPFATSPRGHHHFTFPTTPIGNYNFGNLLSPRFPLMSSLDLLFPSAEKSSVSAQQWHEAARKSSQSSNSSSTLNTPVVPNTTNSSLFFPSSKPSSYSNNSPNSLSNSNRSSSSSITSKLRKTSKSSVPNLLSISPTSKSLTEFLLSESLNSDGTKMEVDWT